MALVKCKGCEKEISKKAKKCPHCGEPSKKKTSLFTWLILIVILSIAYTSSQTTSGPSPTTASVDKPEKVEEVLKKPKKIEPPKKPAWRTQSSKDEMTGKIQYYAASPSTSATKLMDFPYADTTAWLGVGCSADSEWVYFGFTNAPNLTNDENEDGYSYIDARVKWDDIIESTRLNQTWGEKALHFSVDDAAIVNILKANKVLLELEWHGNGATYFEFTLNGSTKSLNEIRSKCAGN